MFSAEVMIIAVLGNIYGWPVYCIYFFIHFDVPFFSLHYFIFVVTFKFIYLSLYILYYTKLEIKNNNNSRKNVILLPALSRCFNVRLLSRHIIINLHQLVGGIWRKSSLRSSINKVSAILWRHFY